MKNCIGKELSKIPMPVSTKYDVMSHVIGDVAQMQYRSAAGTDTHF